MSNNNKIVLNYTFAFVVSFVISNYFNFTTYQFTTIGLLFSILFNQTQKK